MGLAGGVCEVRGPAIPNVIRAIPGKTSKAVPAIEPRRRPANQPQRLKRAIVIKLVVTRITRGMTVPKKPRKAKIRRKTFVL
jgi:hypothetical protein